MEQNKWYAYHQLVKYGLRDRNAWFDILSHNGYSEEEIKEIEEFEENKMQEQLTNSKEWKRIQFDLQVEALSKMRILYKEYEKEHPEWAKTRKRMYLEQDLAKIEEKIKVIYEDNFLLRNQRTPLWFRQCLMNLKGIDKLEKERKGLMMRLRITTFGDENEITPEIIARAREYPIDKIIEVKRNKALCLWHPDKNPSMHYYKKTNTVYCFTCNTFGDAIDIFMKKNNVGFVQAVIFLGR